MVDLLADNGKQLLLGNEAIVRGLIECGVGYASTYPGTPSSEVGNNLETAHGMCGSLSGSIPTDVGEPTIRVQNITVGGRN